MGQFLFIFCAVATCVRCRAVGYCLSFFAQHVNNFGVILRQKGMVFCSPCSCGSLLFFSVWDFCAVAALHTVQVSEKGAEKIWADCNCWLDLLLPLLSFLWLFCARTLEYLIVVVLGASFGWGMRRTETEEDSFPFYWCVNMCVTSLTDRPGGFLEQSSQCLGQHRHKYHQMSLDSLVAFLAVLFTAHSVICLRESSRSSSSSTAVPLSFAFSAFLSSSLKFIFTGRHFSVLSQWEAVPFLFSRCVLSFPSKSAAAAVRRILSLRFGGHYLN